MIQLPMAGEVLVDLPGRGPLLELHPRLQPIFSDRLGMGRVVERQGDRAVDWSVEEAGIGEMIDLDTARTELLEGASIAADLADRIETLLRKSRDPDARVRVPGDLMRQLGAIAEEDAILGGRELRYLRDALRRAMVGVRRAVGRQEFALAAGRVVLYGWCFLPGELGDEPEERLATVTLRASREFAEGVDEWVFHWEARGWPTTVELMLLGEEAAPVPGTASEIRGAASSGAWRLNASQVSPGSRYLARARGDDGEIESEPVMIPGDQIHDGPLIALDLPPTDELELESVDDGGALAQPGDASSSTDGGPDPFAATPVANEQEHRRGGWLAVLWSVLVWLFWLLLAALLIWLLYLLIGWLLGSTGNAGGAGAVPSESRLGVEEDPPDGEVSETLVPDRDGSPGTDSARPAPEPGVGDPVEVEVADPPRNEPEVEDPTRRPLPFVDWRSEGSEKEGDS